jgi:hypothetical protein
MIDWTLCGDGIRAEHYTGHPLATRDDQKAPTTFATNCPPIKTPSMRSDPVNWIPANKPASIQGDPVNWIPAIKPVSIQGDPVNWAPASKNPVKRRGLCAGYH